MKFAPSISDPPAGLRWTASPDADPFHVVARLERLPLSTWHTTMRLIIGSAQFFDAYDALAIAFVLPALMPLWHLDAAEAGLLISSGFAGQVVGAIAFGWLGERIGRIPAVTVTILLFAALSLACAFAWNFETLLVLRFLQGIGLGGETPIAQAYVNEFARAEERGRFSLLVQPFFFAGIAAASLLGAVVVPTIGWRWMFVIGALPALLVMPLRLSLPESPRWLVSRGRFDDADRALRRIEGMISERGAKPLPPIPTDLPLAMQAASRLGGLFEGIYLRRTLLLWGLWFCANFVGYAMIGWLPTLLTTVYAVPLDASLQYNFLLSILGFAAAILCFAVIDRTGRKPLFTAALLTMTACFLCLAAIPTPPVPVILAFTAVAWSANALIAGALGMYTAENYPNHLRALGGGLGAAWLRIGATISPVVIGLVLPAAGIGAVFATMAVVAAAGAAICLRFADETTGEVLELLSPIAGGAPPRPAMRSP